MKITLLIVFIFYSIAIPYSQNIQVDSLKLLLRKQKTDVGRVHLLTEIGKAYGRENYNLKLSYFQQAADLAQRVGYTNAELRALNLIADQLNQNADYSGALQLSLQTLKKAEQAGDPEMIFWIKREIMRTHYNVGDYIQVIEDAKVLKTLVHSGVFTNPEVIKRYSLMGYVNWFKNAFTALNQFDSALYYAKISFNLSRELNDVALLSLATNHLADLLLQSGKFDSAHYLYRQSIDYATASGRFDVRANSQLGIADLFFKKSNLESAFHYVYKSLDESEKFKSIRNEISADSVLSTMYGNLHKTDSAYKYLKKYITLRDKFLGQNTISQVQNLTFTEKFRQQQLEQERKDTERRYETRMKTYSLLAGIAVLVVVAFFLYRNNKIKQKTNALLQEQNQKIETAFADLQSTQAQLIQSEKMASLGELTAGIAHEIQNPLNFVNNFSEVNGELMSELVDEVDKGNTEDVKALAEDIKQNLEKINHHGKRADAIVKGMLEHSKASTGEKKLTNINKLADEYLRLAYHGLRAKEKDFNADLKREFDENIGKTNVVPQDIGRVLLNLFNNAFYAVNEKSKAADLSYQPFVSVQTKKLTGKIEISVKDNGNGIPQNIVDKIFQPFFTTKPTGQGTGLGLSLSYDIVKAHGGEIKVETKEEEGTIFTIVLPSKEL